MTKISSGFLSLKCHLRFEETRVCSSFPLDYLSRTGHCVDAQPAVSAGTKIWQCVSRLSESVGDEYRIQLISQNYETGEKEFFWPPKKERRDLNPSHRRYYYQFRYLLLDPKRLEEFLLPHFCRHPDQPTEVWLQIFVNRFPSLQDLADDSPLELKSEMSLEKQWRCDVET
jgi:hypothetical protein